MLIGNEERRSFSRTLRDEEKRQVLALRLYYDSGEIILQIEQIDKDYCMAHRQDVQEAVNQFVSDTAQMLEDAGLPSIK